MASPQASHSFLARNKIQIWDHDPDTASAAVVSPDAGTTVRSVDMGLYQGLVVAAINSALTGAGITKLEIVAADDAALATNVVVIKDSGTVAADALGDWVVLEATAEEVRQESEELGYTSRYAGGRLTLANSGDEAKVLYIAYNARNSYLNLTPATTIA